MSFYFRFVFACIPWQGHHLPKSGSSRRQSRSSISLDVSCSIEEMSFWKRSPCSSLTAPQFYGESPNASERSVFAVTCCSLISGSSAKGFSQTPHSFSSSVSRKFFYYEFKTVPSCLFVALKELFELFVLDKVSYLWTNENIYFQFCLT